MPSNMPRVQVRLTPEQYEVIHAISVRARLSMSRVVADIIEPHIPVLRSAAQMLTDAAAMTDEAKAALRPMLTANERKLQHAAVRAYKTLAETEAAIKKAGRGAAQRAPGLPSGRRRRPNPR